MVRGEAASVAQRRNSYVRWTLAIQAALFAGANLDKLVTLLRSGGTRLQAPFDDTVRYFEFANQMFSGLVPYRDVPVEYPPFAVPAFLLPRIFASTLVPYQIAFAALMFAMNAIIVVLLARHLERTAEPGELRVRLAWYTLFVVLLSRLALSRFDLLPALLAFAAAVMWTEDKPVFGGVLAGMGTLTKVFPGLVAFIASIRELSRVRDSRPRGTLATGAVVAAGFGLWWIVGGHGTIDALRYHAARGIEFGSLWGGLLLLWTKVTGAAVTLENTFGSLNVSCEGASTLARLSTLALAAAEVLVAWLYFERLRGKREGGLERYSAAAILAFIVMSKVGSPQFLLWVAPFIAVLDGRVGRPARRLFAACCTVALIAAFAKRADPTSWPVIVGYNAKNFMLLALFGLIARPDRDASASVDVSGMRATPQAAGAVATNEAPQAGGQRRSG
jgi:hypothetical protein